MCSCISTSLLILPKYLYDCIEPYFQPFSFKIVDLLPFLLACDRRVRVVEFLLLCKRSLVFLFYLPESSKDLFFFPVLETFKNNSAHYNMCGH